MTGCSFESTNSIQHALQLVIVRARKRHSQQMCHGPKASRARRLFPQSAQLYVATISKFEPSTEPLQAADLHRQNRKQANRHTNLREVACLLPGRREEAICE